MVTTVLKGDRHTNVTTSSHNTAFRGHAGEEHHPKAPPQPIPVPQLRQLPPTHFEHAEGNIETSVQFSQVDPRSKRIQSCVFLSKFFKRPFPLLWSHIIRARLQWTVAVFMESLHDTLLPFSAATGSSALFVPRKIHSRDLKWYFLFRNPTS